MTLCTSVTYIGRMIMRRKAAAFEHAHLRLFCELMEVNTSGV